MPESKLGVGIIGVSPVRGWAATAHIPALRALPNYETRALSAHSAESARAAGEVFGVGAVFSDHEQLVTQRDVDVVAVTVKVPRHRELVSAALAAGKAVYCEWPLGRDLEDARAMAALAAEQGIRTIVGLQARQAPAIEFVRELLGNGYVGEVLSTTVVGLSVPGDIVVQANAYMLDRANGANVLTVAFGHSLDTLNYVLGEFVELSAVSALRRPLITVKETGEQIVKTAADQVAVIGTLTSGATASIHDRSHLPAGTELEQSDATGWMFLYCLSMLRIAATLAETDSSFEDLMTTFLEHAVRIAAAMNRSGLWDDADGFYYDALRLADGSTVPIKVHSMVGLIPLMPTAVIPTRIVERGKALGKRLASFLERMDLSEAALRESGFIAGRPGRETIQMSVVPPARLGKLLGEMLAEDAFLSPHGLRALSKRHRDQPFKLDLGGMTAEVDYEPGESTSGMFGGNSNWRGPIWFPLNYLAIESLRNWDTWLGPEFTVEYPTGSGRHVRLRDVASDLAHRLVSIWLPNAEGRRPVYGSIEKFQADPEWRDLLQFHEYFHGDTGAGLGASHQTGWTGLVAHLLCRGGVLDQA